MAKPKLGSGARFKAVEKHVAHEGVRDPGAVAAAIGRKKYGAKRMAQMSAAGRHKHAYAVGFYEVLRNAGLL